MMMDSGFSEPLIEDPNTTVGAYPWDGDWGATRSYDTTSTAVMTNPAETFAEPEKDATDLQQDGAGDDPNADPEGADMGQPLDTGGDSEGQDFGQDQGEQDTMEADTVNVPLIGSVSLITLAIVGGVGYWLWKREN